MFYRFRPSHIPVEEPKRLSHSFRCTSELGFVQWSKQTKLRVPTVLHSVDLDSKEPSSYHSRLSTIERDTEEEYQTRADVDEEVKSDKLESTSDTDVTLVSNPLHQK